MLLATVGLYASICSGDTDRGGRRRCTGPPEHERNGYCRERRKRLGQDGSADRDSRQQRAPGWQARAGRDRQIDRELDDCDERRVDVIRNAAAGREVHEQAVHRLETGRDEPDAIRLRAAATAGQVAEQPAADGEREQHAQRGHEHARQPHGERIDAEHRHARRHRPERKRRLVQPDVRLSPVRARIGRERPVVECRRQRVADEVLRDDSVEALVPGMNRFLPRRVDAQRQRGEHDERETRRDAHLPDRRAREAQGRHGNGHGARPIEWPHGARRARRPAPRRSRHMLSRRNS